MKRNRLDLIFAFGMLLAITIACNFSATTANISDLKIGKDANVSAEADTFGSSDVVYAVATISNASEKLKVTGRMLAEDVEGIPKGLIPGLENSVEMPGAGTAKFNFTAGESGWPEGTYKVEILMMNEAGEQKDQKSVTFTVS